MAGGVCCPHMKCRLEVAVVKGCTAMEARLYVLRRSTGAPRCTVMIAPAPDIRSSLSPSAGLPPRPLVTSTCLSTFAPRCATYKIEGCTPAGQPESSVKASMSSVIVYEALDMSQ